ncbi:MAG: ScpA family protein [Nanoarchaeota archaeon]
MEQKIFDIIFKGDEVTWQSLILDLVRVQNMDPWDIDVSKLSQDFIGMLKKMQELDLRISGKVVLAAAILLKLKSNYLMEKDIMNFDKLMHPEEYTEDALYEEPKRLDIDLSKVRLIPRTPQPRKRKVSIYELVEALKLAMEVKNRRRQILDSIHIPLPEKKVDISIIIENLYQNIEKLLDLDGTLTFNQLIPSNRKEDILAAFIPLLHLSSQQKIDLYQEKHFGEIEISKPGNSKRREMDFLDDALGETEKRRKPSRGKASIGSAHGGEIENVIKKGKRSAKEPSEISLE